MARRCAESFAAALLMVATLSVQAADPAKVLRVALQTDVTGFDPQGRERRLDQIDYVHVPYDLVDRVLENGSGAEYARRGVKRTRILESAFTYTYFNMDDAIVGGYTPDRVALRRAIAMAYDRQRNPCAASRASHPRGANYSSRPAWARPEA